MTDVASADGGALRGLVATRYATPLREGGSLPAIVEADDGELYVAKFRGAGQGSLALVAEVLGGELARALGLRVPALALLELDGALARTEPDPEIADLLRASVGTNLAMVYLPGALTFDPAARPAVTAELASLVVVFDAFAMNVDRTARNPNLLWWRGELWLIDHGAAFYWQHDWDGSVDARVRPFARVADHVLLPWASALREAGQELRRALDDRAIARAAEAIPAAWLDVAGPGGGGGGGGGGSGGSAAAAAAAARRAAYAAQLRARRDAVDTFVEEAVVARARRV